MRPLLRGWNCKSPYRGLGNCPLQPVYPFNQSELIASSLKVQVGYELSFTPCCNRWKKKWYHPDCFIVWGGQYRLSLPMHSKSSSSSIMILSYICCPKISLLSSFTPQWPAHFLISHDEVEGYFFSLKQFVYTNCSSEIQTNRNRPFKNEKWEWNDEFRQVRHWRRSTGREIRALLFISRRFILEARQNCAQSARQFRNIERDELFCDTSGRCKTRGKRRWRPKSGSSRPTSMKNCPLHRWPHSRCDWDATPG